MLHEELVQLVLENNEMEVLSGSVNEEEDLIGLPWGWVRDEELDLLVSKNDEPEAFLVLVYKA